ncbi:GDSL esterase/lipase At5g14450-like [Hevea brasiliensis]|uniref:GDSL esterase/lipase At5g14450-like n=1 Tax=Hevea brasiliensis TaxID=3981 RepID=UPI0025FC0C5D|nr:GDSL esterase/lipase At5g14450-like [Hevea brasiliensis]
MGLEIGKFAVAARGLSSKCAFPAIYSFGDSTADTGGMSAAFGPVPLPHGQTFFKKPSGRLSDGRLIIDFMAECLGLPYVGAYLDSVGTKFAHGSNFASAGSSIRQGPRSPFFLALQVSQFMQFKARTTELYKNSSNRGDLPNPMEFSKASYTFDIGQNDIIFGFLNTTEDQVPVTFPDILTQFSQAVLRLYGEGARAFLVHNVGPIGCLPFGAAMFPPKNTTRDKNQRAVAQNEAVKEFNRQLKDTVVQLRKQLPQATITYVDVYKVKFSLIDDARN